MESMGRDSSVGIATGYGLDGTGIEKILGKKIQLRARFSAPPSSAEVKERIELYLYSTSGPSWPVIG
jgi:hypothetical protein